MSTRQLLERLVHPSTIAPTQQDQSSCPNYRNHPSIPCNMWKCYVCAPRKAWQLTEKWQISWQHAYPNLQPAPMTLTWRWKRQGYHPHHPHAFQTNLARERFNWSMLEWRDEINRTIHALRTWWKRVAGENFVYVCVPELTKIQGSPHLHFVIKPSPLITNENLRAWWDHYTGDSTQAEITLADPAQDHTVGRAFGHLFKYLINGFVTNNDTGELQSFIFRRFRTSTGFPQPGIIRHTKHMML